MTIEAHIRGTRSATDPETPTTPSSPGLTAEELAIEAGILTDTGEPDIARAGRVLAAAWTRVHNYTPNAPPAALREATIRLGGYLGDSDYGTVISETTGPRTVQYPLNHANAFRNSGAAALLTTWRRRRAGAI